MEIWKDVEDYENKYQISSCGCLKSLKRNIIVKPYVCTNGYLEYALWKNGKRKVFLAHRLVAQAFIPNPNDLPEVNHKDENIKNNNVNNLEWCTSEENANYGTRNERCRERKRKFFKAIRQFTKDGKFIKEYECIEDAGRAVKGDTSFISRAGRGIQKSAYGYIWRIVE